MKWKFLSIIPLMFASIIPAAESGPVLLKTVKAHKANQKGYIELASTTFGTTWFSINLSTSIGRDQFSIALSAINTGRAIIIDPTCTSCSWGAELESISIKSN
jgi:hypothetical protein